VAYPVQAQLIDGQGNAIGTVSNPVVIRASPTAGETIVSVTGSDSTAGNSIVVAGVAGQRIRVFAISLFAPSGTTPVTVTLTDGLAGPALWTAVVQAPNQSAFSFGTATSAPTFLFATTAGNGLVMNLSAAVVAVGFNLSYWTA
jgi:hypothetical protein